MNWRQPIEESRLIALYRWEAVARWIPARCWPSCFIPTGILRLHGIFREGFPIDDACNFVPFIAVPTTSGTGSEVTPFATVWDSDEKKKYSLTHPGMFANLALLDPQFTFDLPWDVTVSTGLDAFCQGLESIWNRNSNPVSSVFALRAVKMAWDVLRQGKAICNNHELRAQLMQSSLFAGIAISQTRTALCHSMSYPITLHFRVPHGLACGFSIPAVLRFNEKTDDGRLFRLATMLGFSTVEHFACEIELMLMNLGVPKMLRSFIQSPDQVLNITSEMITPQRAGNNLRSPSFADIKQILHSSLAWNE